jgi:hypothetical protein
MRGAVEILLAVLPLDARGRRAIDETLADWEHEASLAGTALERTVGAARALFSITSVLGALAVGELPAVPRSRAAARLAAYVMGSSSVALPLFWSSVAGWPPVNVLSPLTQLSFAATVVLSLSGFAMPLLLFLSTVPADSGGRRRTPFVGCACGSFVLALWLVGWVVPARNQEFRTTVFQASGGQGQLLPGPNELTLPELLSRQEFDDRPSRQRRELGIVRLGTAVACPAMVLLAGQVQLTPRRRRRLLAIVVVLAYFGVPALVLLGLDGSLPNSVTWSLLTPTLALLATLWLALRREARTAEGDSCAGLTLGGGDGG